MQQSETISVDIRKQPFSGRLVVLGSHDMAIIQTAEGQQLHLRKISRALRAHMELSIGNVIELFGIDDGVTPAGLHDIVECELPLEPIIQTDVISFIPPDEPPPMDGPPFDTLRPGSGQAPSMSC